MRTPLLAPFVALLCIPALPAQEPKSAQDDPRAVIEKAVRAHGGAEKIVKLRGVRLKIDGSAEIDGSTVRFSADFAMRAPDRQRTTITVNGETDGFVRVLAGDKAWQRMAGDTQELKGEDL